MTDLEGAILTALVWIPQTPVDYASEAPQHTHWDEYHTRDHRLLPKPL